MAAISRARMVNPPFFAFGEFVRARSRPYRRVFRRLIRHFAAFCALPDETADVLKKVVAMPQTPKKAIGMAQIIIL
jgi:hypothetical protein